MLLKISNKEDGKGYSCFKKTIPYSKMSIAIYATLLFSGFLFYTPQLCMAEQEIPLEEIREMIAEIEASENVILNVFIESEIFREEKQIKSEKWKRTDSFTKARAWIDGLPKSKIRVDILKNVIESSDPNIAPLETSYSVGFDGMYGRRFRSSNKIGEDVTILNKAEITADYPKELLSSKIRILTGAAFNLNYFFGNDIQITKFSHFLRMITSEDAVAAKAFKFTKEEFLGVECIKIESVQDPKTGRVSYWLDPGKGFALRGYELVNILKNGKEWVVSSIKVKELKKVADGIWFPTEAFLESSPSSDKLPFRGTSFRALEIRVNSPEFKDNDYKVSFPKGSSVHNKVTGRKYFQK